MNKYQLGRVIGNNVRKYRTEKELTQKEFGNKIGYSQTAISNIENGRIGHIHRLYVVSEALGVTINDLVDAS